MTEHAHRLSSMLHSLADSTLPGNSLHVMPEAPMSVSPALFRGAGVMLSRVLGGQALCSASLSTPLTPQH